MVFTDTHCHIHDPEFFSDNRDESFEHALEMSVERVFCVGTDVRSSEESIVFCSDKKGAFSIVGIHPHDSEREATESEKFFEWCHTIVGKKLIGIGEIGLDYYYNHSPRDVQISMLEKQIDLALTLKLPISFHVRDGFDDFWPIFDNFSGITGVLHSFTDSVDNMNKGLARGLYIGVNGIATFSRERDEVTKSVPLERVLFETDAPFLTPVPFRGKINKPGNIPHIVSFVAEIRDIPLEELSQRAEQNVDRLFF